MDCSEICHHVTYWDSLNALQSKTSLMSAKQTQFRHFRHIAILWQLLKWYLDWILTVMFIFTVSLFHLLLCCTTIKLDLLEIQCFISRLSFIKSFPFHKRMRLRHNALINLLTCSDTGFNTIHGCFSFCCLWYTKLLQSIVQQNHKAFTSTKFYFFDHLYLLLDYLDYLWIILSKLKFHNSSIERRAHISPLSHYY